MHGTNYHAKYFAHYLTLKNVGGAERLSRALFDACVDINPHQIEAALFALQSPIAKGVILADEVGLGKTIEAGILLCQLWAEKKRRLLVITPASIRKQWALELSEKFALPAVVLDSQSYREARNTGNLRPFDTAAVVVTSFQFAARNKEEIRSIPWNRVVVDEAHKLRNAYRPSNHIGRAISWAIEAASKILLTATPLQNSLLELYGLTTLIDEHIFGSPDFFRSQYMRAGADLDELRARLRTFCKRTLRKDVTEFVSYTERRALTQNFDPTNDEQRFYDEVSAFLQREDTYSLPPRHRHLLLLILRKLLASSVEAVAGTLEVLRDRLLALKSGSGVSPLNPAPDPLAAQLHADESLDAELLDEILDEAEAANDAANTTADTGTPPALPAFDIRRLGEEITTLENLLAQARNLNAQTKPRALLAALSRGFQSMDATGAARKALVFTESRRTQDALKLFLEANGWRGRVALFNGTNAAPESRAIYDAWLAKNVDTGRASGSRAVDSRTAIIEHFRDDADILLATEAAAEGVNLQFCSLVINYDLPWNPQRIEQRIGRCHRYGQKHDVVVINFLNSRNHADLRVYQLLAEKFSLFSGVFGASDDVLGSIEEGMDFEQRILSIYQECRTPQAIEEAFHKLREELESSINSRMDKTRRALIEHFDADVHDRLRLELADTRSLLDAFGKRFWFLSRHCLGERAEWRDADHSFLLREPPASEIPAGRYFLISKQGVAASAATIGGGASELEHGSFLYRISHPLGEWVLSTAKQLPVPYAHIAFNISAHPVQIALVSALKGNAGFLRLTRLTIQSYEEEEYLCFSAFDDAGQALDQETCEKLFLCETATANADFPPVPGMPSSSLAATLPPVAAARLAADTQRHIEATISRSLETNNVHFAQARERLERWADDSIAAAEHAIADTKEQIRAVTRQSRLATTLAEQHELQEKIQSLEKKKRRQRQDIFDVEDAIHDKRDALISELERRLTQHTKTAEIFTIRWSVI